MIDKDRKKRIATWVRKLKFHKLKKSKNKFDYHFYLEERKNDLSFFFEIKNCCELDFGLFFFNYLDDILFFEAQYKENGTRTALTLNAQNAIKKIEITQQYENDPTVFYYYKWNGKVLMYSKMLKKRAKFDPLDNIEHFE